MKKYLMTWDLVASGEHIESQKTLKECLMFVILTHYNISSSHCYYQEKRPMIENVQVYNLKDRTICKSFWRAIKTFGIEVN